MKKGIIIPVAVVSPLLILVAATGVATVATTHSANPFNIKELCKFNSLKLDEHEIESCNYRNVKEFVDAKGCGTLIAKKTTNGYEFTYFKSEEKITVAKENIAFKDWGAVHFYRDNLEKRVGNVAVEPGKEPSENNNASKDTLSKGTLNTDDVSESNGDTNENEGSNENYDNDSWGGTVVVHRPSELPTSATDIEHLDTASNSENYVISDELKKVLDEFHMNQEELDKMLSLFWKAKREYMGTQLYGFQLNKFENFRPNGHVTSFLQAPTEATMKCWFYEEKKWSDWKELIEATFGKENFPNPVSACGTDVVVRRVLAKYPSEKNVQERLEKFVNVFYKLAGTSVNSANHRVTLSQGF